MTNYLWKSTYVPGFKVHISLSRYSKPLQDDLVSRLGNDSFIDPTVRDVSSTLIDLPGMIMADRSVENIKIDTLNLGIPSSDFEYFYGKLAKLQPRTFADGQVYYKLHGYLVCLVLTEEQRNVLLSEMDSTREAAKARANKDDAEFEKRIKEINKKNTKVLTKFDLN